MSEETPVRLSWGAGAAGDRRVHWPDPRLSGRSLCDLRLSVHEHEDVRADRWQRWCRKNGCRQQFAAWLSQHAPSFAREYAARVAADEDGDDLRLDL